MKTPAFFILLFSFAAFTLSYAQTVSTTVQGCTNQRKPVNEFHIVQPPNTPFDGFVSTPAPAQTSQMQDWSLMEQKDFDLYLAADRYFAVWFNGNTQHLETIEPVNNYDLTGDARSAVDKAPQWMRNDLIWVFSNITPEYQDFWASGINDAQDPYIDEIAFAIAHSSPQYLMSDYGTPDLFLANAQMIYEHDQDLDYVEVVDYGTSATDADYYTTTRYYTERDGNISQQEVPRDIYYWYIVHPKITDEIHAYIDPDIVEDNSTHNNNIADPPVGKFWREFLYSFADENYPVLKDSLAGCPIVWDGTQTINSDNNYAIEIITNWINQTLNFDSDDERPHQPVRIYRKHKGRCGEYADFSAAAARAALIPCTSIFSYSTDHTWNEFWDEDWTQWEPVNGYVNRPLVYENGWGKVFGTVFEIRSDGFVRSVTDRYSEGTATINVEVHDANGDPVDGAEVRLYIKDFDYPVLWSDFYTLTGNDGKCSVVVGDGRDYYVRVHSAIGDNPASSGDYVLITTSAVAGETYNTSLSVSGNMPSLNWSVVDTPAAEGVHYRMAINFSTPEQLLMGTVWMDDVASDSKTCKNWPAGWLDFFMTDENNYQNFASGSAFDAFNRSEDADQGDVTFYVPSTGNWYCIFSNKRNLNNLQHLTGSVSLYSDSPSAVDKNVNRQPGQFALLGNYPNPFNPVTSIRYRVARTVPVTLTVFNAVGQKVRTLVNTKQGSGQYEVTFDAGDLPSGVYFYRLRAGAFNAVKKCLLIK